MAKDPNTYWVDYTFDDWKRQNWGPTVAELAKVWGLQLTDFTYDDGTTIAADDPILEPHSNSWTCWAPRADGRAVVIHCNEMKGYKIDNGDEIVSHTMTFIPGKKVFNTNLNIHWTLRHLVQKDRLPVNGYMTTNPDAVSDLKTEQIKPIKVQNNNQQVYAVTDADTLHLFHENEPNIAAPFRSIGRSAVVLFDGLNNDLATPTFTLDKITNTLTIDDGTSVRKLTLNIDDIIATYWYTDINVSTPTKTVNMELQRQNDHSQGRGDHWGNWMIWKPQELTYQIQATLNIRTDLIQDWIWTEYEELQPLELTTQTYQPRTQSVDTEAETSGSTGWYDCQYESNHWIKLKTDFEKVKAKINANLFQLYLQNTTAPSWIQNLNSTSLGSVSYTEDHTWRVHPQPTINFTLTGNIPQNWKLVSGITSELGDIMVSNITADVRYNYIFSVKDWVSNFNSQTSDIDIDMSMGGYSQINVPDPAVGGYGGVVWQKYNGLQQQPGVWVPSGQHNREWYYRNTSTTSASDALGNHRIGFYQKNAVTLPLIDHHGGFPTQTDLETKSMLVPLSQATWANEVNVRPIPKHDDKVYCDLDLKSINMEKSFYTTTLTYNTKYSFNSAVNEGKHYPWAFVLFTSNPDVFTTN